MTITESTVKISETNPMDVVRIKESEPANLEQRVARLEAKLAIIDLMASYAAGVQIGDAGSMDGFADDVEYVLAGTIDMRANGKKEMQDYHRTNRGYKRVIDGKRIWRGSDTNFRHMMCLPVIRVADDCQTAWVTMHFSGFITRFTPVHSDKSTHDGTYILTLGKQDGRWQIKKFVNITELAHDPLYHVVDDAPMVRD